MREEIEAEHLRKRATALVSEEISKKIKEMRRSKSWNIEHKIIKLRVVEEVTNLFGSGYYPQVDVQLASWGHARATIKTDDATLVIGYLRILARAGWRIVDSKDNPATDADGVRWTLKNEHHEELLFAMDIVKGEGSTCRVQKVGSSSYTSDKYVLVCDGEAEKPWLKPGQFREEVQNG